MAAQFQFVMRSGPTVGKVYPLETPEVTIGREGTNTISINDVEISRRHARMEMRGPAYIIQDLGSTNGTFVNGQRVVGATVLNPGDSVAFGEGIVLSYESAFDPNATMMSPGRVVAPVQAPPTAVASIPVQPPPPPAPAPVPSYSGQVPAGPAQPAAPRAKKKFPIWLIIVILVLVVICLCAGFFIAIDQFNLWCKVLPFLVPILGGTCA